MLASTRSAKQLTIIYLSIAVTILHALHFWMVDSTLDEFELANVTNRFEQVIAVTQQYVDNNQPLPDFIPPFTSLYRDRTMIPAGIDLPESLPEETVIELDQQENIDEEIEHFVLRKTFIIAGKAQPIFFVLQDSVYEKSEEQIVGAKLSQLSISLTLLLLSLFFISKIAKRLTHPLTLLANELEQRAADDLSPLSLPQGAVSSEIVQLISSINQYNSRIRDLLTRERSFNRYASHELRTPLMVIKGASSLLGKSNDPAFINKQRLRLLQASNEMNDFVATLLSLTRNEDDQRLSAREVSQHELQQIIDEHKYLLDNKKITCRINMIHTHATNMPEPAFKILLGNLLKNAFACTETGSVTLEITQQHVAVIDTGIGLKSKPRGVEGYGLGLLISRDICRKYGWQLTHMDNIHTGCTAIFQQVPREIPTSLIADN